MIITDYKKEDLICEIDIGRPDIFDGNRSEELALCEWIIESDIEIAVNSVFNIIHKYCQGEENYMGGGFKYMFWFTNEKDKETFKQKIVEFGYKT